MTDEQTQANSMLGTVNWWRKLLLLIAQQGTEYAAIDGDLDHASVVMRRMIDTIEAAAEPDGTFNTTLRFKHADGRAVQFEFKAALIEPDGTFSDFEE